MELRALRKAARQMRNVLLPAVARRIESIINGEAEGDREGRERLLLEIRRCGTNRTCERYAARWFLRLTALRYLEARGLVAEVLADTGRDALLALSARCSAWPGAIFDDDSICSLVLPDLDRHRDELCAALGSFTEQWSDASSLGWLYQFWSGEQRRQRPGQRAAAEDLAAATQLFTPDWISRYLVENSMGCLWLAGRPESDLRRRTHYYLSTLDCGPGERRAPEQISVFDPCCGSGQILREAYSLLREMYIESGYPRCGIPRLILENNLYGFDIDECAARVCAFTLSMAAYDDNQELAHERPLRLNIIAAPRVADAREAVGSAAVPGEMKEAADRLLDALSSVCCTGSLLRVPEHHSGNQDLLWLSAHLDAVASAGDPLSLRELRCALFTLRLLSRRYSCVVTNPPYLSSRFMPEELKTFARREYRRSKADLFAMFIERAVELTDEGGLAGLLTMHSWMFLPSFRALREEVLRRCALHSLLHLGPRAFSSISGEVVQTAAFILAPGGEAADSLFLDLTPGDERQKEQALRAGKAPMVRRARESFQRLPGSVLVYWADRDLERLFAEGVPLGRLVEIRQGLATADNARFLRRWFEIPRGGISFDVRSFEEAKQRGVKWVPYNKGGCSRRWYGNHDYVLRFDAQSITALAAQGNKLPSRSFYFRPGLTWNLLSSEEFGVRVQEPGFAFDVNGMSLFARVDSPVDLDVVLAFLASGVCRQLLTVLNPTLAFQAGNAKDLPFPLERICGHEEAIVRRACEARAICKEEWDESELSWNFAASPLLQPGMHEGSLHASIERWRDRCRERSRRLATLEEDNDRHFAELCGVRYVPVKRRPLPTPTAAQGAGDFVSYAIGCLLGREWQGGGEGSGTGVLSLACAHDALEKLMRRFWPARAAENMEWLAGQLAGAETAGCATRSELRTEDIQASIHRYLRRRFLSDHLKRYRGCPIYFQLVSGPLRGCEAIINLHRCSSAMWRAVSREAEALVRDDAVKPEVRQELSGFARAAAFAAQEPELCNSEEGTSVLAARLSAAFAAAPPAASETLAAARTPPSLTAPAVPNRTGQ